MSVSITLPCGCRLNAAFVIGMCVKHAYELRQAEIENENAYEQYRRMMADDCTCGSTAVCRKHALLPVGSAGNAGAKQ